MAIYSDLPPDLHRKCDAFSDNSFAIRHYNQGISGKGNMIADDNLVSIKKWCNKIHSALQGATKHSNINYLPLFYDLGTSITIRESFNPLRNYDKYAHAKTHLDFIRVAIQGTLDEVKAPNATHAKSVLLSLSNTGLTNGWDDLYQFLVVTIPQLGHVGYNIIDKVKELKFILDRSLLEFATNAKSVHEAILTAGIKTSPNALFKCLIDQMMHTVEL